jgi:hypothetical protein
MSEKKAFPLRLNPDLYDEVRRWAEADLRSVNAQIEFLLRQAVVHRRAGGKAASRSPVEADPDRDPGGD